MALCLIITLLTLLIVYKCQIYKLFISMREREQVWNLIKDQYIKQLQIYFFIINKYISGKHVL